MENIKILNPPGFDIKDLKVDTNMSADHIISTHTYPNGFVITYDQRAEEVSVSTNRPLIKIDDTTYQIPE